LRLKIIKLFGKIELTLGLLLIHSLGKKLEAVIYAMAKFGQELESA
jgi:hypothetical protein